MYKNSFYHLFHIQPTSKVEQEANISHHVYGYKQNYHLHEGLVSDNSIGKN